MEVSWCGIVPPAITASDEMSRKNGTMSEVLAESKMRAVILGSRKWQSVFSRLKLRFSFESSLQKFLLRQSEGQFRGQLMVGMATKAADFPKPESAKKT
jgi:hypothetical protein